MSIRFAVTVSPDHSADGSIPQQTPNGNPGMEVGGQAMSSPLGSIGKVTWSAFPEGIVEIEPAVSEEDQPVRIIARAFGRVDVTARDAEGNQAHVDLYVGSVIIVGADGKHWRFFSDGSVKQADPNPVIQNLVDSNVIVANLTGPKPLKTSLEETPVFVTCYLLNLTSFTLNRR